MSEAVLEPLEMRHVPEILAIERESFPAPWTEGMFRQEVEEKWLSRSFVALVEGRVAGYVVAWMLRSEMHILNLAIAAPDRRQGLARRLLDHVLGIAESESCQLVTLEVRVSNEPARRLYMAMGFAPVGIRRRYYHDNDEDALVMTRRLKEGR